MKEKKFIKITVKVLLLLVVLLCINAIIVFCTYEKSEYAGTIDKMYEEENNIDILILGSSHAHVSFDEKYMSDVLKKNVYNAGTPVQKPDAAYYILKEATKTNDIEKVYLDMFYYMYHDNPKERTNAQLEFIYLVSDEMKWSMDKIHFLMDACPTESYLNAFVKGSRNAVYLMDIKKVEEVIKLKRHKVQEEEVTASYYTSESEYSMCVKTTEDYQLSKNNLSDYSRKYLKRMAELCRDNNIELVLLATPMTDYQLSIIGDYDDYVSNVRELADEMQVKYRDYNLCKKESLGIGDDCFSDIHHLNPKGTRIFTEKFLQFESGELYYDECFYDTYKQKKEAMVPTFFGINVFRIDGNIYEIIPICSQKMDLVYEVIYQDMSVEILSEGENKFCVADSGQYIIKVTDQNTDEVLKKFIVDLE